MDGYRVTIMIKNKLNNKNARFEVRCGDANNTIVFTNDWQKSETVRRFQTDKLIVIDLEAPDGKEVIISPEMPAKVYRHTFKSFCTKNARSYYYPKIKRGEYLSEEWYALQAIQRVISKAYRAENITLPQQATALGMEIVCQSSKSDFEVKW